MSLLTICQNVCAELSIPIPGLVAANADPTTVQLKMLVQRVGDEVAREHDWSDLMVPRTFTASGSSPEPSEPPNDWERFATNAVIWNNSRLWQLNGPVDVQTWQRNTVIHTNPVPQIWRIQSGHLAIYPNNVGETISYFYLSANWINLAGGGTSATWVADGDTAILPERIIELGTVWRWKRAKGLDFALERETYKDQLESAIVSDRAAAPTSLSLPNRGNVPDSYWPGLITVTP